MTTRIVALFFVFVFSCSVATAQFQFGNEGGDPQYGPRRGESIEQIWRAGLTVQPGSQLENVTIMLPIPLNWPEQTVVGIEEEKLDPSMIGGVRYDMIDAGAREAVIRLNKVRPHRQIEIVLNVRLVNYELLPPTNPDDYVMLSKVPAALQKYVKKGPFIECNERVFKTMFHEITKDKKNAWEKVEAIYAYVQNNVKYDEAQKFRGTPHGAWALTKMPEGQWSGDCKDMCCLFVALCRAGNIPARIVRVPEHCYAEFYLELRPDLAAPIVAENKKLGSRDEKKPTGFWFPCQVSGAYSFGGIPERQPILQKGDSYPDRDKGGKAKKLFLVECFEGNVIGEAPPRPVWIREIKGQ